MTLRAVLVDDNATFLASARALLDGQVLQVVATATSPAEAVRLVGRERPDVVVVDLHLGSASGLDLARELSAGDGASPAVVLVSTVGYDDLATLAAGAPVRGFLTKTDLSAEAVTSIVCGSTSA